MDFFLTKFATLAKKTVNRPIIKKDFIVAFVAPVRDPFLVFLAKFAKLAKGTEIETLTERSFIVAFVAPLRETF